MYFYHMYPYKFVCTCVEAESNAFVVHHQQCTATALRRLMTEYRVGRSSVSVIRISMSHTAIVAQARQTECLQPVRIELLMRSDSGDDVSSEFLWSRADE